MVFLTLVIGLLNVCLGYALAVYLGYGPPGLPESWEALKVDSPPGELAETTGEPAGGLGEELAGGPVETPEEALKLWPYGQPEPNEVSPP